MDKTIGTKLPEEEAETLEKIAAERGESVSGFVRNLVRKAIEKNGKVDQNPAQNSDSTTAKKIEEVTKLLSRFPPDLAAQIGQLRDEIGQISKASREGYSHPEFVEILKRTERAVNELKQKIGGIRVEAGTNVSFKNPEFRKKILIGWASGFLLFFWLGGWGAWHFYQYGRAVGIAEEDAYANPFSKTFDHLMLCNEPGWKTVWMKGGTELWCFPYSTSPGKGPHGWMIQ